MFSKSPNISLANICCYIYGTYLTALLELLVVLLEDAILFHDTRKKFIVKHNSLPIKLTLSFTLQALIVLCLKLYHCYQYVPKSVVLGLQQMSN